MSVQTPTKKRRGAIAGLVALSAVLLIALTVALYAADYSRAGADAAEAMTRAREDDGSYAFGTGNAGLILYPGGKVADAAYAPLAEAIAARCNIVCVVVRMPLHLAVLEPNAADHAMARFPDIRTWYVGGHSLGGVIAASYAAAHPDTVSGVVLLAAYSTEPLSMPVLSVYGQKDTVLNREKYRLYRDNLPRGYTELEIPGGNHAGFGDYGAQDGDTAADVGNAAQWAITADAVADWLSGLN